MRTQSTVLNRFISCFFLGSLIWHQEARAQISHDPMKVLFDELAIQKSEYQQTQGLLNYLPLGNHPAPLPSECDPQTLEELIQPSQSTQEKTAIYNQHFKKCEPKLKNGNSSGLLAMQQFANINYRVTDTRWFKTITLQNSNGTFTEGFLMIKPDQKKRPFVILKCGLFCEARQDGSALNFIANMFDQSPFNIMILANHTGNQWVLDNHALRFGGFDEALEVLEIALWLRDSSPYKEIISSLHLVGVSLGGHTALYSTLFNDRYAQVTGQKVYNSVMAMCPVVQLKETMNALFDDFSIVGQVAKLITLKNLKVVLPVIPEALPILQQQGRFPSGIKLKDTMADLSTLYMSLKNPLRTLPISTDPIKSREEYWEYNSFLTATDHIDTPSLLMASKDDMIVSNSHNTYAVENSELLKKNEKLGVVNLNYGNHCGFNTVYGMPTVSAVFRSFILSNSPEMQPQIEKKLQSFDFGDIVLNRFERHVQQTWHVQPNSKNLLLEFKIFRGAQGRSTRFSCQYYDPYQAPLSCYRTLTRTYQWDDILLLNERPLVTTEAEAQALTRELNGNLRITADHQALNGSVLPPTGLEWKSFEKL